MPTDPVITFLCSPNNPTGRAEPLDQIRAVVDITPDLVVVDEAYGQFAPSSAMDLVRSGVAGSSRVVVVRTFSKTWAMAGLRLGYLIGSPEVVRACEMVALPYHLDAAKQLAGRLALQFVDEMETRVAMINEERGRIAAAFSDPAGGDLALRRQLHPVPTDQEEGTGGVGRPPRCIGTRARLFAVAGSRPGAFGSPWGSRRRTTGSWPH